MTKPPAPRQPNRQLADVVAATGLSAEALARRVNALAAQAGLDRRYTHTSVQNWARRGMVPRPPAPALLAQALSERLARPVTPGEIGMTDSEMLWVSEGLAFPRDLATAVQTATTLWSHVDRRDFLTSSTGGYVAATAYATPLTRWLVHPADPGAAHRGGRTVGAADVAALREAAAQARRWDSRYGGGDWRTTSLTRCLHQQAAPLLHGTYSDRVGRSLFAAAAELCRVAAFAFLDAGHHDLAQAYFVQALRLARAAGDVPLGGYVLATMALHALLRGRPDEAVDMAQAATERTRGTAPPRAAAFYRMIEARAHARAHDAPAAEHALAAAETLLARAGAGDDDALGLAYLTHERLAADATEVYHDLHRPDLALRWNAHARMPADRFARAVGMRMAIVACTHLRAGHLEESLHHGQQALTILTRVTSARASDYLRQLLTSLAPWQHHHQVKDFTHHAHQVLATH